MLIRDLRNDIINAPNVRVLVLVDLTFLVGNGSTIYMLVSNWVYNRYGGI